MNPQLLEAVGCVIKDIQGSLSCPVCYGMLINPTTIKDCGHSLCSLCVRRIIDASRDGKCPLCTGGAFSRRKGTVEDQKLSEFIQYLTKLQSIDSDKNSAAKTDGFLLNRPKLGRKKKTVPRKQKGRPIFSLESNLEPLNISFDEREGAEELLDSPCSSPALAQNSSFSLLTDEKVSQSPRLLEYHSTPKEITTTEPSIPLAEDYKNGLRDCQSSIIFYPPQGRGSKKKRSEPKTFVQFFFNSESHHDHLPGYGRKVCLFYQLSSLVPSEPSKHVKYPSIVEILRQKSKGFKTPSSHFPHSHGTPGRHKRSEFKQVHHRRLVNDSTPSRNKAVQEEWVNEYGASKRLSKKKIIAAEPVKRGNNKAVAFATSTENDFDNSDGLESRNRHGGDLLNSIENDSQPRNGQGNRAFSGTIEENQGRASNIEDDPMNVTPRSLDTEPSDNSDSDLPEEPMHIKDTSKTSASTQDVLKKMNKLQQIAAELNNQSMENKIVPPSDEETETFPCTPEMLPQRKKKRGACSISMSEGKRLRTNEGLPYSFPPGTKIMSSALYTESNNSIYDEFRELYKNEISFKSGPFDRSIDILVIGTLSEEDNRCNRTVKYLYALACGKLIVSLNWIRNCFKSNRILDPAYYIVKDHSGSDGPRKSFLRSHEGKGFFSGFEFGLIGEFESDFGGGELCQLITYGGGRIFKSLNQVPSSEGRIRVLIADKDAPKGRVPKDKLDKILKDLRIVTIDKDWLIESMGRYALEMLDSYLLNDVDTLYRDDEMAKTYSHLLENNFIECL